ncbi:MAG: cation:proton antiporter [Chloroflexota bacterium]
MHEIGQVVAVVGVLILLAHLLSALFAKTRVPDPLVLMLVGLLLGPVFGITNTEAYGQVGPIFTVITLLIVLFEAGIGLRPAEVGGAVRGTMVLSAATFTASMLLVAGVSYAVTRADFLVCLMLGAAVGSLSPAVIVAVARRLGLKQETYSILVLESTMSDVLSVIIFVALFEAYKLGQLNIGAVIGNIVASFVVAAVVGFIGAFAWSMVLKQVRELENSMFMTAAVVFVVYGAVELMGFSGAIAALAFGIVIGNPESLRLPFFKRFVSEEPIGLNRRERTFFSEISFLLRALFFVYAGISLQLTNWSFVLFGLGLTVIMYMVRIPITRYTVEPTMPDRDISMVAVMIPKGLAAVVLASIPFQQGYDTSGLIQSVAYSVVLFSLVLTSVLVFLLEKTRVARWYRRAVSRVGEM